MTEEGALRALSQPRGSTSCEVILPVSPSRLPVAAFCSTLLHLTNLKLYKKLPELKKSSTACTESSAT